MELCCFGAGIILLFFNPFVFVYCWDFALCSLVVCLYFVAAALIYERAWYSALQQFPVLIQSLSRTRLDPRLPVRLVLYSVAFSLDVWYSAGDFLWNHRSSVGAILHLVPKRLAARSLMPLVSITCGLKSASQMDACNLSMSLMVLALILCGKHMERGCAMTSALLAFIMVSQCQSVSIALLCGAIEYSTPVLGKLAQQSMKRPAAPVEYLSIYQLAEHEAKRTGGRLYQARFAKKHQGLGRVGFYFPKY
jgi:hypothetical protein